MLEERRHEERRQLDQAITELRQEFNTLRDLAKENHALIIEHHHEISIAIARLTEVQEQMDRIDFRISESVKRCDQLDATVAKVTII